MLMNTWEISLISAEIHAAYLIDAVCTVVRRGLSVCLSVCLCVILLQPLRFYLALSHKYFYICKLSPIALVLLKIYKCFWWKKIRETHVLEWPPPPKKNSRDSCPWMTPPPKKNSRDSCRWMTPPQNSRGSCPWMTPKVMNHI
jgi:hypothetical protein